MLPSVCDIPQLLLDKIKDVIVGVLSFLGGLGFAILAAVLSAIQQVLGFIKQFIAYIKSWIESGARLFLRLLDLANSRSIPEACAKYNALVEDFGNWAGWQNVVDTLQLDCTKIPKFSVKDLCALLDDVVYDEIDGVRVYRVLPKTSKPANLPPEPSDPSPFPDVSVANVRADLQQWWQSATA
jgi:hypothetical protein